MKVLGRSGPQVPLQPQSAQAPQLSQSQGTAPPGSVNIAHETNDFRPLTAGEIKPGERVIKEFPNPQYGAAKLKQIAAAATGEVATILGKAAAAADRISGNQGLSGRSGRDERPDPNEGRLLRQVRVVDGQHTVRTIFQPAMGRPVPVNPESVEGLPNGANVKLKPDGTLDTSGARLLNNMIGTVVKENGQFFAVAKTAMSPIDRLPLVGGSDELVGKLVVVDVQNATSGSRTGLIHDVLTPKSEMQRLELTAAADAGVPITFPAAVLKQLQELKANPPAFDLKPGMRDLRSLPVIATDNPGSRSDYRSVDPEQASNVSFEAGRMVLTDFLANRKLIIPEGSPIDAHAMEVMQTFYGSGFDAAALPMELSEDLAVFLADRPRYATAVKAVFDVVPSQPKPGTYTPDQQRVIGLIDGKKTLEDIGAQLGDVDLATKVVRELQDGGALTVEARLDLDASEVFDALINNKWAGSYRDADRVYAAEKGDRQFDATVQSLPSGVKEQLDAFKFAGSALRKSAEERGQLNAGNDNDGRYQSEQIRESFSTSINEVVALIADKAGVDTIQRYHPEAKEEKLTRFREFASAFGVPWPEAETFAEYVDKIPERVAAKFAERTPAERTIIEEAVRIQAYRTLEKAIYSVDGGGHAGLAKAKYAHSSASNRQNTGKPNLDMATYASDVLQGRASSSAPYSKDQLVEIAEHATDVELLYARVVERQIENLRNAVELKPFEGQTIKGVIVGVNPGGVEVKTLQPGSKVFVPLAALGDAFRDRFDISDSNTEIRARNRGVRFAVAQTVDLNIKSVDAELGSVDALLVADPNQQPAPRNDRDDRDRDRGNGRDRGNDRNGGNGGNHRRNDRNDRNGRGGRHR